MSDRIVLRARREPGNEFIELHIAGKPSSQDCEGGQYITLTRTRLAGLREALSKMEAFINGKNDDYQKWEVS